MAYTALQEAEGNQTGLLQESDGQLNQSRSIPYPTPTPGSEESKRFSHQDPLESSSKGPGFRDMHSAARRNHSAPSPGHMSYRPPLVQTTQSPTRAYEANERSDAASSRGRQSVFRSQDNNSTGMLAGALPSPEARCASSNHPAAYHPDGPVDLSDFGACGSYPAASNGHYPASNASEATQLQGTYPAPQPPSFQHQTYLEHYVQTNGPFPPQAYVASSAEAYEQTPANQRKPPPQRQTVSNPKNLERQAFEGISGASDPNRIDDIYDADA